MDGLIKNIDVLLNNFSNKTRLMIITLIINNGPMTVTQLSKVIKTSRSNLYQIIKGMLRDNVLIQDRVETNKNYVEKYYNINEKLFSSVRSKDIINAISNMNDERLRDFMVSFLTTASAVISMIAGQVAMADTDDMKRYHEEIKNRFITMSFSSISKEMASRYYDIHRKFMEDVDSDEDQNYDHLLYVISFPVTPYSMFLNRRNHH
ncbi:winged helix-turn-helix domain-containing protein [Picrophilus oshimae]|uniref:Transcriptional regulator, ArsR family n=1 Tax=Picrophilus torridus (strain ATCC 700027 / DSM 9790 / JCM 10055 / NBRC 100828 / KAW 2/3) TaxID=1122961 RepID=A0A8G2L6P6_PICTO|nr:winged helix-turn-helix domain-containing protein [Picrophilus oshimae]SMD30312.1 transcriptional regulator, ArsR family [Picrophilus oshimae DSM 9789]